MMEMTREEARNAVIQHYMDTRHFTRKQAEDYIHDDDRVFWLLEEVQKEVEMSKRIGKRPHFQTEDGFTFYETYYLDENEPVGSWCWSQRASFCPEASGTGQLWAKSVNRAVRTFI